MNRKSSKKFQRLICLYNSAKFCCEWFLNLFVLRWKNSLISWQNQSHILELIDRFRYRLNDSKFVEQLTATSIYWEEKERLKIDIRRSEKHQHKRIITMKQLLIVCKMLTKCHNQKLRGNSKLHCTSNQLKVLISTNWISTYLRLKCLDFYSFHIAIGIFNAAWSSYYLKCKEIFEK